MNFDWQNITALAIVATAVVYVARRLWHSLAARRSGCGACASCPATQASKAAARPMVSIDALVQSAEQNGDARSKA